MDKETIESAEAQKDIEVLDKCKAWLEEVRRNKQNDTEKIIRQPDQVENVIGEEMRDSSR